jgi:hypothetical protein
LSRQELGSIIQVQPIDARLHWSFADSDGDEQKFDDTQERTQVQIAIESFLRNCGSHKADHWDDNEITGVEGALIGWYPFAVSRIVHERASVVANLLHEYRSPKPDWIARLRISSKSTTADISWALESVSFSMYVDGD